MISFQNHEKTFQLEKDIALHCCSLLRENIEELSENEEIVSIPVNAESHIIEKVFEFCRYYTNHEHSDLDNALDRKYTHMPRINLEILVEPWFYEFTNFLTLNDLKAYDVDPNENFQLFEKMYLFADFLGFVPMTELLVLKFASVFHNVNKNKIREEGFNIDYKNNERVKELYRQRFEENDCYLASISQESSRLG